ncbi:MAG: HTH domain-containing protein [Lachnospiraceae bacterium]|nr:HTH domain-containing protein [Clostridia bacterium]MBR1691138.1 HTH domain-containing protein [Lachnospiraceae bacterium]
MRKEEVEEIARIAAAQAIASRDAVIEEEIEARYQDVQLLMQNYRKLKAYYDHVGKDTLEVGSICKMHTKTGLMMSHVDKMLSTYEVMCRESSNPDEQRRWDALSMRYIGDERMNAEEIAERLHIDKRTVYRDIGKAMEDMAVLLFGIEAIGSWKKRKQ